MPPARSTGKVFTDRPASADSFTSPSGSSAASTDSETSPSNSEAAQRRRRIRKKITDAQFAALEATFVRNSHPSVQERETLGEAIGM